MASNYEAYMAEGNAVPSGGRSYEKQKEQKLSKVKTTLDQRKKKFDEGWSKMISLYSNEYPWEELSGFDDTVVPNMVFSTVNVIVPSIAVNNPRITVTGKSAEDHESAQLVEAVVNHQWREFDVQDEVRDAVKDFVILGHGWVKVVWDTVSEDRELPIPEWQQAVQAKVAEYQQAVANSPLSEDEFPSLEEVVESVPRTVTETVRDAPLVRHVSPFDMIVDPDAFDLQDARWIAQRSFVPIKVAKDNEDWDRRARNKLKPSVLSEARDVDAADTDIQSKEAGFAVVYEYYDLIDKTFCVFAENCEHFLVKPTKSPFPEVHPFVFIENYQVPERFYPIGDVEMIFSMQTELALTRTQMINDRKRGKRINLMRSGSLGPDGIEQLENDEDDVLLDVLDDRPFNDVFQPVNSLGLPPEWYNQSEMIINDINMVTGVSEYARGMMPEIKRTATEAGLIQDAANARSADKLHKVEQAMARVAARMIRLSQVMMDGEDVAKVVDDNRVVAWVQYDRLALQGDFTFEIDAGSSQPQNESFRRQAALQLMDTMGQFIGSGFINDQKLLEHVLRNGFGIKDAEQYIGPGPMPPPPEEGMPPEVPPEMAGVAGMGGPPPGM